MVMISKTTFSMGRGICLFVPKLEEGVVERKFSLPLPSSLVTDENHMEVKVLKFREQKYVCTAVYSEIPGNHESISSFKLSFQV